MTTATKDRKISNFLAQTSLPSDAYLTYISGNTNYKISLADFNASLGVTGTIEQQGDPLGTPILDKAGSVNGIRNIEDGSGIKTSVSAQDGVTIAHNFIEDTTGVELVVDLTADQPKFRSIEAGAGINVAASNGTIQIALSAIPVSTKTVIVNSISDFPAAVGGIITLADDTEYAIRNDIATANRFVLGNNTVLSGSDSIVVSLSYTDVGTMFTSVDKRWKIKNLTCNCTSGTFIDFDGTGVEIFQLLDSSVNCDTFGTMDDLGGAHFDDCILDVTTDGLTFGGSNNIILIEAMSIIIDAGTMFDMGTSTFNGFSLTDCFATLNGASIFLSGLAASANINSGGLGSVHNCRFSGTGTALDTIAEDDIRWQFFINDDIPDTHKDCLMSQIGNVTNTVIAAVDTPVKLAGTWTEEHASQFTTDATGRITYAGVKDTHFDVTFSFTGSPVASTKNYRYYVALNGATIANSAAANTSSSSVPGRTTLAWRLELSTGDYLEAWVENNDDATDMLITDAIMRIS
jgi:hypothetical protein